MIEHSL